MARAPRFKIYSSEGRYLGCLKDPSDAAAVVSMYGDGAQIRDGHAKKQTVWTEGADGDAGDSYDHVATTIWRRVDDRRAKSAGHRAQ